ncbi:MAG TPA: hypothetical protein VFK44_10860 [Bacillales bacterium]|nr:hypothetical protein [Bacillales bacterium]
MDAVGSILKKIGYLLMIAGFIAGIVIGNDLGTFFNEDFAWSIAIYSW